MSQEQNEPPKHVVEIMASKDNSTFPQRSSAANKLSISWLCTSCGQFYSTLNHFMFLNILSCHFVDLILRFLRLQNICK